MFGGKETWTSTTHFYISRLAPTEMRILKGVEEKPKGSKYNKKNCTDRKCTKMNKSKNIYT
jgi:hypothetical protein